MARRLQAVTVDSFDGPADEAPPLDDERGSAFSENDRLFLHWRDGKVLDYSDWHARDLERALGKDYKMRQLEWVLCGPLEGAAHEIKPIKGDSGEAEWFKAFFDADEFSGGCETPLAVILSQLTSAKVYRKAFFELTFAPGEGDFTGKYVYKNVGFRPATTCRLVRDPITGRQLGFQQEPFYIGGQITRDSWPIEIGPKRSFVYVHGQRRDPINGTSDLEVAYWCYQTKQKILFLWFQFAENASLPRTAVIAQDEGTAMEVARQVAAARNGGVVPVTVPGGAESIKLETLDISGKGGDQFKEIVSWLDQAASNSVLAGFTQLTDYQKSGGSWALSSDASDFFLQTLAASQREIAREVRRGLLAPLCRYNFGRQARVPAFEFEPLNSEDKSKQVDMLQAIIAVPNGPGVPSAFIEELAGQVASYWGMPIDDLRKAFRKAQDDATAMAKAQGANSLAAQVAGVAGATAQAEQVHHSMRLQEQQANNPTAGGPNGQRPTAAHSQQ